jgi:hypothetical protein
MSIPLPGLAAIVDKDEADRLRANARELNVEGNVEVEADRVVVWGLSSNGHYLCIHRTGKSSWIAMDRIWFDVLPGPRSTVKVEQG